MARLLVAADDLHKGFGGKTLLDGASFQLDAGERVAIVGPNGSGKSTFLSLLTGAAKPDAGQVRLAPHARVAVFHQHPDFAKDATVKDALLPGGGAPPELVAEATELEARMADPALYESGESEEILARYTEVQSEIARAKGSVRVDAADSPLFEELGFTDADLGRKVASLSGGERTRLFLARTLAEADPAGLLVLDEPTNHLDVETIEWLEERLQAWPGAVLVVAHDRAFLDNVATRVVAFENGRLASYPGNYTEFERRREEDAARLEQRRANEKKELERQKAVIEQFKHQKRFNGQMASRLTALAKYRAAVDKTPDPLVERVQMSVGFPESFKSSNDVMRVRDLAKRYGDTLLFHGLDLDVRKGDRIGLVGANGAGKTTLLRILVGKEKKDLGTIDVVPGVKGAYFAQGNETLEAHRTLREEVLAARPGLEDEDVRALLGRFGFRAAHDLSRKVSSLSGGERSRLALLKVVIQPSNLLILDEPTNHLDLESRAALVRALNAYKGTLLVVSHDRWFLDSVITSVAVLARHGLKVFPGDLTAARTSAMMEEFQVEKPTAYLVKKAFKDFDTGEKHTVGKVLQLMPADLNAKRLYRTALSMGWMVEER